MASFSIVIPTFNRAHILNQVIESVCSQSSGFDDIELIVCDSDSADGTADLMSKWINRYPTSVFHFNTSNNVSKKRNEGLARARYDHVIFLDDDCVPDSNFIETYRSICLRLLGEDDKKILCGETRFPQQWINESNYYRFRDSRHFDHTAAVAGVSLDFKTIVTMNMCVRKSGFVAGVRGFDETFVGYGAEDQELGWRLQQSEFSITACEARAIHHEMSNDVRAFGDKIRRTARDGMTQLLKVAPEAAQAIRLAQLLDADYPNRTIIDKLAYAGIRVALGLNVHRFLGWLLIRTDKIKALYFPLAYRAYMACCYALGAGQRAERLSTTQAAEGWVGKVHL